MTSPVTSFANNRGAPAGYPTQSNWCEPEQEPTEEWWLWKQHQTHLDLLSMPGCTLEGYSFSWSRDEWTADVDHCGAPLARKGLETIAVDIAWLRDDVRRKGGYWFDTGTFRNVVPATVEEMLQAEQFAAWHKQT